MLFVTRSRALSERGNPAGREWLDVYESGDPGVYLERLRALVASRTRLVYWRLRVECTVQGIRYTTGDMGSCSTDRIVVDTGLSPALEFSVVVHEFTHQVLCHGPIGGRLRWANDWEAEAAAVACLLAAAIGLEGAVDAASAYLVNWSGALSHLSGAREHVLWAALHISDGIGPRQLCSSYTEPAGS